MGALLTPSISDSVILARPHRQQQTISRSVSVTGFGFWSGRDVTLEFKPAPVDAGIVFVRSDLEHAPRIPALVENRLESPRRTILAHQGVQVEMVEHVMAALAGLRIDNCEVWLNSAEVPGFDGSSKSFVDALLSAEIVEQDALRSWLLVTDVTRIGDADSWIEARPIRSQKMRVKYRLDYGHDSIIGRETYEATIKPERFITELAPARTFILKQEAEWLRQQGLAERVTPEDVLVFDETGLIDNELRYEDECVRHKVLDLVGDLALAGCDIVGQFVAHRSGHRLNANLAQALLSECQLIQERRVSA